MNAHSKTTPIVFGTDDVLSSLCNSVVKVLGAATHSHIQHSAMVQRISTTCLKPDIGCFVLFDGGFSGLVILNFTSAAAMELYSNYMVGMGVPSDELALSHTTDEVGNVMGELMNQILGDFTSKVRRELQTQITQNQPKMLVLQKQVLLSVNANLDNPESRRVTFFTERNNIFYMEMAIDRTEFTQLFDFEAQKESTPDEVMAEAKAQMAEKLIPSASSTTPAPKSTTDDTDDLLKSLGM